MNTRQSSRSTRIDLRIPNDLLETVQKLASERFNAPIHHISGKPEITPIIVRLIELGIGTLSENNTDTDPRSGKIPDKYPDSVGVLDRFDGIDRQIAELDRTVAELLDRQNHQGQRAIDLAGRVESIEATLDGLSCLLPPATTAGEVDRVTALENRTEEMMKTLLELQEAASIARRGEKTTSISGSSGDDATPTEQKLSRRAAGESPKSKARPTFTTDLSIEEIRSKLEIGEGLTHAEFIKHKGLSASVRTVGDWPAKLKKSIEAGKTFAPREFQQLGEQWEYRQERWYPIES